MEIHLTSPGDAYPRHGASPRYFDHTLKISGGKGLQGKRVLRKVSDSLMRLPGLTRPQQKPREKTLFFNPKRRSLLPRKLTTLNMVKEKTYSVYETRERNEDQVDHRQGRAGS
jgi:hypothetical protein